MVLVCIYFICITMTLFDSHCHLQFSAYDNDRDKVISRAIENDVLMIAVGTTYEDSEAAVGLAKIYPGQIFATVGLHPNHASVFVPGLAISSEESYVDQKIDNGFYKLAQLSEVVAIGECGLDYYRLPKDPNEISAFKAFQRKAFIAQIQLAKAVKKSIVIHSRESYGDVFDVLREESFPHGILMHFFQGGIDEARKFLEIGAYFSFAGPVTFTTAYDDVVKYIPIERIMVETDSPYASPSPHRGKRNEPLFVKYVAERVAEIKKIEFVEAVKITSNNARAFFNI